MAEQRVLGDDCIAGRAAYMVQPQFVEPQFVEPQFVELQFVELG
jgi:hypothetical protein